MGAIGEINHRSKLFKSIKLSELPSLNPNFDANAIGSKESSNNEEDLRS